MRASEAEREATVEELRLHGAAGRLDPEELEQRVEAAFGARTREQLADLRSDLPDSPVSDFDEHLRVFLSVQVLLVVVWALTGAGYFWPIWPFVGWGIGVVVHWFSDRGTEHVWASGSRRTPRTRRAGSSWSCCRSCASRCPVFRSSSHSC